MLREIASNEWFTVLIVLCIGILALARFLYTARFEEFLSMLGDWKYLKIYVRGQKFIDQFDALLFINLIISAAIFSFISYNTLVGELVFDIILLVKITVGIGALILIKIMIERLIGSLFEIDFLVDSYLFQKTNYKNYAGLILLPVNLILIYALEPTRRLVIGIIIAIVLINLSLPLAGNCRVATEAFTTNPRWFERSGEGLRNRTARLASRFLSFV